jgi:hypothetical protein
MEALSGNLTARDGVARSPQNGRTLSPSRPKLFQVVEKLSETAGNTNVTNVTVRNPGLATWLRQKVAAGKRRNRPAKGEINQLLQSVARLAGGTIAGCTGPG